MILCNLYPGMITGGYYLLWIDCDNLSFAERFLQFKTKLRLYDLHFISWYKTIFLWMTAMTFFGADCTI